MNILYHNLTCVSVTKPSTTLFIASQEKRAILPRFYFIGDDDLLEILGQSTNPLVIQSHLKKLFAGIHSVEFDENNKHIVAMKSLEGEVVPLKNAVEVILEVEVGTSILFD